MGKLKYENFMLSATKKIKKKRIRGTKWVHIGKNKKIKVKWKSK